MSRPVDRNELRRRSFNEVAELYDETRPTYPEQLIEDIIRLSGIPTRGRILEIGCGTGQATLPFARRGFRILCLEPGDRLAAIARRRLNEHPGAEVTTTTFEEWQPEPAGFDLVTSAQAFHWVEPDVGYARAAVTLKDSGSIALFWNFFPAPDDALRRALDRVYREHVPGLKPMRSWEEQVSNREKEMDATGRFEPVTIRRYPWESVADAGTHIRRMSTQSDHIVLDPETRHRLFDAIRGQIERHGGVVRREVIAVLFLARKRG